MFALNACRIYIICLLLDVLTKSFTARGVFSVNDVFPCSSLFLVLRSQDLHRLRLLIGKC